MNDRQLKICPRYEKEYTNHPAISRTDNKTYVCPKCGTIEAIRVMLASKLLPETLTQFSDEEILRMLNIPEDLW